MDEQDAQDGTKTAVVFCFSYPVHPVHPCSKPEFLNSCISEFPRGLTPSAEAGQFPHAPQAFSGAGHAAFDPS
jgi:hypothetical protein